MIIFSHEGEVTGVGMGGGGLLGDGLYFITLDSGRAQVNYALTTPPPHTNRQTDKCKRLDI